MKYAFFILVLCSTLILSGCGKTEEQNSPSVTLEGNGEDIVISEDIPEPTGEEDILPKYLNDEQFSTEDGNTDEKILFFYSEESEVSKEFDAILNSDEKPEIYSDIIRINFDDESSAKENYGIVAPNSFVLIDESGTLVKKIENVANIENILTLYE